MLAFEEGSQEDQSVLRILWGSHLVTHSYDKYLLSAYYESGYGLRTEGKMVSKGIQNPQPHGVYSLRVKRALRKSHKLYKMATVTDVRSTGESLCCKREVCPTQRVSFLAKRCLS